MNIMHTLPSHVLSARLARSVPVAPFVERPAPLPPVDDQPEQAIVPLLPSDGSDNPLRPSSLDEMVGQERLKPLLRRIIDGAKASGEPLDHLLLLGGSGTGKSTIAHVVHHELGRRLFQLDAPVAHATLVELREVMLDGDILFVDEIHQQVTADRRGSSKAAVAETFYHVMEDRKLATARGLLDFPKITVIGATTDAGMLPEPFLARFPLQPRISRYTVDDMTVLAMRNAQVFGIDIEPEAATMLAEASRLNPRVMNRYVRNAKTLRSFAITRAVAREIIEDLNATTLDGLTADMQMMMRFLFTQARTVKGETRYQASVNSIATATGHSRDTKAVALYVEPYLIERGLVQVAHGGRILTPAGIRRVNTL